MFAKLPAHQTELHIFYPPRRPGIIFQAVLGLALLALSAWQVSRLTQSPLGLPMLASFFLALLAFIPVPLLVYRLRALLTASYALERDGIRLRWGLRQVDIPMDQVQWVHHQEDLLVPLPLPWLFWLGAVLGLGKRRLQGGAPVEFLAARTRHLVLVGTQERVYVLSPVAPDDFVDTYQTLAEYGSLFPIPARSVFPAAFISHAWSQPLIRILLVGGLLGSLALLTWVVTAVPGLQQVSLGFTPDRLPLEPVPASALLLLPFLCGFFYLVDVILGLFLYRRAEQRYLAYSLWAAGALTPLLFLLATYFILYRT